MYVDDVLVTGSNLKLVEETKRSLQLSFKIIDLGELKYFLEIEFVRSNNGVVMHQRKYALQLISEIGLSGAKIAGTHIDNMKLTSRHYDEQTGQNQEEPLTDQVTYQKLIRKLLYLNMTRPDISLSVQTLNQFLYQPKKSHMDAALGVVKYIKRQPGQGISL